MEKKKKKATAPPLKAAPVNHKVNHLLLATICTIVAILIYSNTIMHGYVLDDDQVLAKNSITKKGISAIPTIFKTAYRAGFWERKEGLYRPLSVVLFAIEWELFPNDPRFGHLINILLYGLTASLLYRFLRLMFQKHHPLIPFFITLLYIVMPVHTEVAANIKSSDELLCFLFAIISMHQLNIWLASKKVYSIFIAMFAYFLALLSKESAITLIAVYPMFAYYFSNEKNKTIIITFFSFFSVAILFLYVRFSVIGMLMGNSDIPLMNNSLVATTDRMLQISTAIAIAGKYLWLMLVPIKLSHDYSINTIPLSGFGSLSTLFPLLIFLWLIFYAIKGFIKKNPASFGIFFFIITFSIASNVLLLIESTMGERFIYMPSLGFCMAVVFSMMTLVKFNPKSSGNIYKQTFLNPVVLIFFACILLYSGRTIARNADWKSDIILIEKDLKVCPESSRLHFAYGNRLLFDYALKEKDKAKKRELTLKAINALEKGISITQTYSKGWYHLGVAYKELNDFGKAKNAFFTCKRVALPDDAEGFIAEGLGYAIDNKYDSAIFCMNKAYELDSLGNAEETLNNLGTYYSYLGKTKESLEALNKLTRLTPQAPTPYYNIGNTYAKTGDYKTALSYYQRTISLDPTYMNAINNLGNCYSALQIPDSAKIYYQMALDIDPNDIGCLKNIVLVYNQLGDTARAATYLNRINELTGR